MSNQKEKRDYKDIMLFAFACIIVILLMFKSCGGRGEVEIKETVVYDTVYEKERIDTIYIPKETKVFLPGKAPKPLERWDTLYWMLEAEGVDTLKILEDYYSIRIYDEELPHKYGRAFIKDTITRNKVIGRGVTYDFNIPVITRTITLNQPKRNALFVGGGLFGNKDQLASGYNVNLSLKTRKDRMLEIGYNQFFNGQGYFELGYKHKISFRKQ